MILQRTVSYDAKDLMNHRDVKFRNIFYDLVRKGKIERVSNLDGAGANYYMDQSFFKVNEALLKSFYRQGFDGEDFALNGYVIDNKAYQTLRSNCKYLERIGIKRETCVIVP